MNLVAILKELDYSPLYISLKTGVVATILSFFLGIFAAKRSMSAGKRMRAVLDGILTLPMVLPPTAAGFFLLLLFSRRRPVGMFLYEKLDIKIVQSWAGCVIAATVIAFPLMYRNARAAFEQIDPNLIYAARTLGMSETKIFWKVILPLAGGVYAPDMGWFPGKLQGVYTSADASRALVLSRGLGTTESVPRWNNIPEVVVVELYPQ